MARTLPGKWTDVCSIPKRSLSFVISEKIPFLLLSGLAIAFSMSTANKLGIDVPFYMVPLSSRITNALVSYWVYIQQIIWPTNLAFFYPFPHSTPLWQAFLALIFLIATTVLSFKYALKAPFLSVGWLWYLGTLLPAIGIIQAGLWPATANRFAYIPEIGLLIIVAWGIYALLINLGYPNRLKTIPIFIIVFGTFFCVLINKLEAGKIAQHYIPMQ